MKLSDIRKKIDEIRENQLIANNSNSYVNTAAEYQVEICNNISTIIWGEDNITDNITNKFEEYLRFNAELLRSSGLSYTLVPEMKSTLLLCDIANMVAENRKKNGAVNQSGLKILMPHLENIHSNSEGYPNLDELDLKLVLRTHVAIKNGRYLLPISFLLELVNRSLSDLCTYNIPQEEDKKLQNPYCATSNFNGNHDDLHINSSDITKFENYSDRSLQISQLILEISALKQNKLNLEWKLSQLFDNVSCCVKTYRLGHENYIKERLIIAKESFYFYYNGLQESDKNQIPEYARHYIEHLNTFMTEFNKTMTQCTDIMDTLNWWLLAASSYVTSNTDTMIRLSNITLSDDTRKRYLTKYLNNKLTFLAEVLKKELTRTEHYSTGRRNLSNTITKELNHYINSRKFRDYCRDSTSERINTVYEVMKDNLNNIISDWNQLRHILQYLNKTQRSYIYNKYKDKPTTLDDIITFHMTVKCLDQNSRKDFFDRVKMKLPMLIDKRKRLGLKHDMTIALSKLTPDEEEEFLEIMHQYKINLARHNKINKPIDRAGKDYDRLIDDFYDLRQINDEINVSNRPLFRKVFLKNITNLVEEKNSFNSLRFYMNNDEIAALRFEILESKMKDMTSEDKFINTIKLLDGKEREEFCKSLLSELVSKKFDTIFRAIKNSNTISLNTNRVLKPEMLVESNEKIVYHLKYFFGKLSKSANSVESKAWKIYITHTDNIRTNNEQLLEDIYKSSCEASLTRVFHAKNKNIVFNNPPPNTRRKKIIDIMKKLEEPKYQESKPNQEGHELISMKINLD